tara:strand:- start:3119 stop:4252 length:1134 start_codon:yes stop_codon:yes gene_type:complete
MNARYDIDTFVRSLNHHNKEEFEIVVAHDDRVNDGSAEHFRALQNEFENLKVVTRTEADAIEYLDACIAHYEDNPVFSGLMLERLKSNVLKYKLGTLLPQGRFLWLSSGALYNMAVEASSGDNLIVTPGDFLYMFPLSQVEDHIEEASVEGLYYGKPNAIWARLTNMDREWVTAHTTEIHRDGGGSAGRWDSPECLRDYLRFSQNLEDYCIPDFKKNRVISLTEDASSLRRFAQDSAEKDCIRHTPAFHGFHIMTRKSFEEIGGFSEEWYGRAWADDKMTSLGLKHTTDYQFRSSFDMSGHFYVCWCGQHEMTMSQGPGYDEDWERKLQELDPLCDSHPIPSLNCHEQLHYNLEPETYMTLLTHKAFDRFDSPVRLT